MEAARAHAAAHHSATTADGGLNAAIARMEARRRRRHPMRLLAMVGDGVAITVAFLIAGWLRHGDLFHLQSITWLTVLLPVYAATALTKRAYNLTAIVDGLMAVRATLLSLTLAVATVALVTYFLKVSAELSRAVFGGGALLAAVLLPAMRLAVSRSATRLLGGTPLNEVVIEDGARAVAPAGAIRLDAAHHDIALRLDDPVRMDRLGRVLAAADRVIVACTPDKRAQWSSALKSAAVSAEVFAEELDELRPVGLRQVEGRTTLIVGSAPLSVIDRLLKRALDLILVIVASPVLLLIMVPVALAVRLSSKGPVFFRQHRVGFGNRTFTVLKFRSMYVDRSDATGRASTRRDDDRITPVGRFIRATSLDELPQVLNVLIGDMSIVGPRPHAVESTAEERLFWHIDERYWHRHAVKPGLTGLAQVRGFRGATEREVDLVNRLQADLEYLAGWSIWRDLMIIVLTLRVLIHRNAF